MNPKNDPHLWQAALAMARTAGDKNHELRAQAIVDLASAAVNAWLHSVAASTTPRSDTMSISSQAAARVLLRQNAVS